MRVALYARVSTGSEEQEQALQQQLTRLRQAAAPDVPREFIDVASGSRDDRPQLQAMLAACRNGQVDRVIVTRLDRMSRSMSHGAQLLSYFSAQDTPVLIALDDGLDLNTIGGRLVARMLINLGQAETERLSERVIHGKQHQREQRRPFGPFAPYGYRFNADRSNYELDPVTSSSARAIVEHFIKTTQVRETLRFARTMPGAPFKSTAGLMTWMLNPGLCGCRCYGRSEQLRDADGRVRRRQLPIGRYQLIIPDQHEPLISPVEHAKARAIYEQHRNRRRCPVTPHFVRELTGLVICAHCGHVMSHHSGKGGRYLVLRCAHAICPVGYRNRIKAEVVKDAIWSQLRADWELVAMVASGQASNGKQDDAAINNLVDAIRELEARRDPDLGEAIQRKRLRLQKVMKQRMSEAQMPQVSAELREALRGDAFWEAAAGDQQTTRRMFSEYVEQVLVADGEVESVQLRLGGAAHP